MLKVAAGKITKSILANGQPSPFTETPDQMVRRVCRELGAKKNIIVLNDEAHHCYRRKPDGEDETLTGDDRIEAKSREEEARIWISGIEAVKAKIGVKAIYDLSATPFFLRADIDEAAWSSLYSTVSHPFAKPETGKIAVKVINHYGDEVLKVFEV